MRTEDIFKKYGFKSDEIVNEKFSEDYIKFKQETFPVLSFYEKICKLSGKIISVKVKNVEKIKEVYEQTHLDIEPFEASSFSILCFFVSLFLTFSIFVGYFLIFGQFYFSILFFGIIISFFIYYYTSTIPDRHIQKWRLKASSQMVPCILYVVIYMKQTSNLERAIKFASEHLEAPLSADLKKIFWDVQVGKYSTLKSSLDAYLEGWREFAPYFVESFHLIESSLYEPSEDRRIDILEKSLSVILDGVYENMMKYSRSVRSPLTNIFMLGIVLPTLSLALLPLASALLQGLITWPFIFIIFNLFIPFLVFYITSDILAKRPGGYGDTGVIEKNPYYQDFLSREAYIKAFLIVLPLLILGLLPFIFQFTPFPEWVGLERDYSLEFIGIPWLKDLKFFDFRKSGGKIYGPFGIGAVLLSLFIPLSVALFFSIDYKIRTKRLIKVREDMKKLEDEFSSLLFQIGNRLGDGIPAEIVFSRMIETSKGMSSENFFKITNSNIQQLGMNVERAIFDEKRGAIVFYPSSLIETSMRVMVESTKKGLKVAANSLISISEYVRNIKKINERLKDMLAEVASDMRSNMSFLGPVLIGIVIGLASMMTLIISRIENIVKMSEISEIGGFSIVGFADLFKVLYMIPPYYMQISVGIYIVEVVFILTTTLVSVENGTDKLGETYEKALNLKKAIILYILTAFISITLLSLIAALSMRGLFS